MLIMPEKNSFTEKVVNYLNSTIDGVAFSLNSKDYKGAPRMREYKLFHRVVTNVVQLLMRQTLEMGAYTSHDPYVSSEFAFVPKAEVPRIRWGSSNYQVPKSTHIIIGARGPLLGTTLTLTHRLEVPSDIEVGDFDILSGDHAITERIGFDDSRPYLTLENHEGSGLLPDTELMEKVLGGLSLIASAPDHQILVT